jgi:hypothetical protein
VVEPAAEGSSGRGKRSSAPRLFRCRITTAGEWLSLYSHADVMTETSRISITHRIPLVSGFMRARSRWLRTPRRRWTRNRVSSRHKRKTVTWYGSSETISLVSDTSSVVAVLLTSMTVSDDANTSTRPAGEAVAA